MNGTIYVLGGKNSYWGGPRCNNVEAYTPGEDAWRVVGETPEEQLDFSACGFQDRIYLFGGRWSGLLNTCFSYDPKNNEWSEIEKMNEGRVSASCCVFAEK